MKLSYLWIILVSIVLCQPIDSVLAKAPKTSKIVFWSDRDGNSEIYLMNPDGSDQVRLTRHPSHDLRPRWSPTGEAILFKSNRNGRWGLYIMDADGANVKKLFDDTPITGHATWSPDGEKLAYSLDRTIYIATREGRNVEEVAKGISPTWSPDGQDIAYIIWPPTRVWILNIETRTEERIFFSSGKLTHIAWSPDNTHLALAGIAKKFWDREALYIMKRDGSDVRILLKSNAPFAVEAPVWSPRGDELLYQQREARAYQIFKIDVESRRERQLTEEGRNWVGDWFDPATLPVQPKAQLLTTLWGRLKKQ